MTDQLRALRCPPRRLALLAALAFGGCLPLGGEDGGVDGGPLDGSPNGDMGADMGQPQGCNPGNGIAVDINDDRQALDPEALEAYDGVDGICVGSSLVGVPDCAGQIVMLPEGGAVCVPDDDPEGYQRQAACSDTTFFIERPRWLAGPIPASPLCGGDTAACLRLFLPLIARANSYAWFCASGDVACQTDITGGAPLRAHVESVLPVDDVPGAHLPRRAYRLWFEKGDARVPVRDVTSCDLISTLRDIVPEGEALLGRECDVGVHKAAALISAGDPQAIWHVERMGLPAPAIDAPPVVVVDAGVPHLAFVRSAAELSFSGANPMSPLHLHGIGMALAIRTVSPTADIESMRVMNTNGRGNTADVARGIDRAAREAADLRVMNLSIGLAPETRLARVVSGPSCETLDDGVGESIAIALEAAKARHPEMLAFGAPGNRPIGTAAVRLAMRNVGRELVEPGASLRYDDPCRGARTRGWFFPAMLARCAEEAPIVGIGGISDRDLPISVAIPDSEPPLVAPAQHIFLNGARAMGAINRPGPDPVCMPSGDGMPSPELPMVLSGTSLAAAFASGTASWMLGRDPTLSARQVARLMYVTGRPLCRDSAEGIPVRALHVGRLHDAMTHPAYADLRDCVDLDMDDWLPEALYAACEDAVAAIGLVEMCEDHSPLGWPEAYAPDACPMLESAGPADVAELPACDMTCKAEVSERALGPGLVGEAGPQPDLDPCVDCNSRLGIDPDNLVQEITLEIELSDHFDKDTIFEEPWFIVKDALTGEIYVMDIDDYADSTRWTAGAVIKVTDIPASKFPGGDDPGNWTSSLVPSIQMNVVGAKGVPVQRTSALRVTFEDID